MKNRILIIASRPLYPLVGGDRIRTFNTLRILSEKYDIDLIFIKEIDREKLHLNELRKYTKSIKCFKFHKFRFLVNTTIGLITNRLPLQVNYYYFTAVDKYIQELIANNNYEFVFGFHIRTTRYIETYSGVKIVDLVDSLGLNYLKAKEKSKGIWKLIYKIEATRVKKYEAITASKFEKAFVISEIDRSFIGEDKIKVIGNYVNVNRECGKENIKQYRLSFLGKMNYEPNISAVKFFMEQIHPKLLKLIPDLEFFIIGAFPSKEIQRFETIQGVTVTGFVDDPYELILTSQVVVAPMVSGAGVQNKILEAMALKKCVVTTEIGAEGLVEFSKEDLIVCNNTDSFILSLYHLLKDPDKCNQIGENAKNYIDRNYSFEKVKSDYLNYI